MRVVLSRVDMLNYTFKRLMFSILLLVVLLLTFHLLHYPDTYSYIALLSASPHLVLVCCAFIDAGDSKSSTAVGFLRATPSSRWYVFVEETGKKRLVYIYNCTSVYTKRLEVSPHARIKLLYTNRLHYVLSYSCVDEDYEHAEYEWCHTRRDLLYIGLRRFGFAIAVMLGGLTLTYMYIDIFKPVILVNLVTSGFGGLLISKGWKYLVDWVKDDFELLTGVPEMTEVEGQYRIGGTYFKTCRGFQRRKVTDALHTQLRVDPTFNTEVVLALRSNTLMRYKKNNRWRKQARLRT